MYEPSQIWSYRAAPAATTSRDTRTGSSAYFLDDCTMSPRKPNAIPPGSFSPLALLTGKYEPMCTTSACFAAYAKSPVAASPAACLYAEIMDIPICIADHLEVVPPSQVLETMVGILTTCHIASPTSAF